MSTDSPVQARALPFVSSATVCERVLRENDGVPTLVRLVDTFYFDHEPALAAAGMKAGCEFSIVVGLKSGPAKGKFSLSLSMRPPKGHTKQLAVWPIVLEGGTHGLNAVVNFGLPFEVEGTYWFDVLFEGERLTSIPVTLRRRPSSSGASPPEPAAAKASSKKPKPKAQAGKRTKPRR
jgi:hypothetical protein